MYLQKEFIVGGSYRSFKNGNNSCGRGSFYFYFILQYLWQYCVKVDEAINEEEKRHHHNVSSSDDEYSEPDYDLAKYRDADKSYVSNIQQENDAEQKYKDYTICKEILGISKRFKGSKNHNPKEHITEVLEFIIILKVWENFTIIQIVLEIIAKSCFIKPVQYIQVKGLTRVLRSLECKRNGMPLEYRPILPAWVSGASPKDTQVLESRATLILLRTMKFNQNLQTLQFLESKTSLQAQTSSSALKTTSCLQAQTTWSSLESTLIIQAHTIYTLLKSTSSLQAETTWSALERTVILQAQTTRKLFEVSKIQQAQTARPGLIPPQIVQALTTLPALELLVILQAQRNWPDLKLTQIMQDLYFTQTLQAQRLRSAMELSPITQTSQIWYPLKAKTPSSVQQVFRSTKTSTLKKKAIEFQLSCTAYEHNESTQDPTALDYNPHGALSTLKVLGNDQELGSLKPVTVYHLCEYKSPTVQTETNLNAYSFSGDQVLQTTRTNNENQANNICFWNKQNESHGELPNQKVDIHPHQNSTFENPPDRALNLNNSHNIETRVNVPEKNEEILKMSKKKCPRGSKDRQTYKNSNNDKFVRNVDPIPSPDEANTKPHNNQGTESKGNLYKKKKEITWTSKENCSRGSKRSKTIKHSIKDDAVHSADPNTYANFATLRFDVIPTFYQKWKIFCTVLFLTFPLSYSNPYQQQVVCPQNYISHDGICCSFAQCSPGYQVKTCSTNLTADTCEKCPDGTMSYDSTSSLLVISCFNVRHECPSDTIPVSYVATDKDPKACSKRCRCNTAANYCGTDPCSCKIGHCEKHYKLQQNCGCSPMRKDIGGNDDHLTTTERYISETESVTTKFQGNEGLMNQTTVPTTLLLTQPRVKSQAKTTPKPEIIPEFKTTSKAKTPQHPTVLYNEHNNNVLVAILIVSVLALGILAAIAYYCKYHRTDQPEVHHHHHEHTEIERAQNVMTEIGNINAQKVDNVMFGKSRVQMDIGKVENVMAGDGITQYIDTKTPLLSEDQISIEIEKS